MAVHSNGDLQNELRRSAEALDERQTSERRIAEKERLDRLIHEVHTAQVELELRNKELMERGKIIEAARENYSRLYEKYVGLFDFAPCGYLVLASNGRISDANQTAAVMFNIPKVKLTGRCLFDMVQPDDRRQFALFFNESRLATASRTGEFKMLRLDEQDFIAQVHIQAFDRSGSSRVEHRVTVLDVSERVSASRSLTLLQNVTEIAGRAATAGHLLKEVVGQIKTFAGCDAVGVRVRDALGNIPYQAYEGFSRAFYDSENPLSLHTDQCMCIEVVKGRANARRHYFTTNGSFYANGTTRLLAGVPPEQLGKTRNVCNAHGYESVALVPITVSENILGLIHVADHRKNMVPLPVVAVLENVGLRIGMALQRFYMQDKLRQSLQDLHDLSSHLIRVQEEEQRRIAMELHDQTGQELNVLKLRIKALQDKLRKDQPRLKEGCAQVLTQVDNLIDDVRRMAHGLNPAALESLGLVGAVRQMVREFSEYCPMKIKSRIASLAHIVDQDTQIALYRIIQEALTNTYKHARATEVKINAAFTTKGVQVLVGDNGRGASLQVIERAARDASGMGVATMHLRARMIGARLTITTRPGRGTWVKVVLPGLRKVSPYRKSPQVSA